MNDYVVLMKNTAIVYFINVNFLSLNLFTTYSYKFALNYVYPLRTYRAIRTIFKIVKVHEMS